jgi:hypothetical protein
MFYLGLKVAISAIAIVAASELAKRSPLFGGVIISLPLGTMLAVIWLYIDTGDRAQVAALARSVLFMVFPGLTFLLALPLLLRLQLAFPLALIASIAITAATYGVYVRVLDKVGISF